ncbi:Matrix remodeling-associated protein 8 [Bagarius yarrelli]|uniref:Matrix remodeling-associated protein 8 n=1 Tax=Bagarius yarrelli TaxID=175774 RepID=A0A556V1B3_BAGYA|nr:Matrix remodeling-associated protein 8 [Bagarius yarrelli]
MQHCRTTSFIINDAQRYFTSATDSRQPSKRWTTLELELEEFLTPRKLSVTPLESWLSLRYSLPPPVEAPVSSEEGKLIEEVVVLPPLAVPVMEDDESSTPLSCKNVLEIRRRKMNRHKYKKLMKRTKFLRRHIMERRQKRKQDQLRDRQRVVHWDLNRNRPDYTVERVLDMFSGGPARVYNAYNKGRVTVSNDAFSDGNFSLIIHNVDMNDKGMYTCNLHHHYCKIDQSIQIQLNITKSPRKERRVWDGEKSVFVVLEGSSVVLPCINRRPLWRGGLQEDQQQVVHWDFQGPGIRRDQAERLLDLYASGEKREYGPLYLSKMHISNDAFILGDFSLTINNIQPSDKGLYSCHLHHHYCGLHERRIFRVIVGPPAPTVAAPTKARTTQLVYTEIPETPEIINKNPDINKVEASHVFNVILPESQTHLLHQAGYILAFFLLLLLILIGIVMTTKHCKKKGLEYDLRRADRNGEIFNEVTNGRLLAGPEHALQDSEKLQAYTTELFCSDPQETIRSLNTHIFVGYLFRM